MYSLLPRVDAPAHPEERARSSDTGRAQGHILLVEDDAAVRTSTLRVLSDRGYVVLPAASGEEALELEAAHGGRIDLILTDVVLPGMNGRELAERLAERRPSVPVLFTSGYNDDLILARGTRRDAVRFLPKPFTPSTLLDTVVRILRARGT